jgi:NAD(P)-dependent dehydrogenase (short-subunit alcohol dehydrogenase family)
MPRTYLVTGSASGIGKATADLLRSRGDRVIGADLHDADITVDLSSTDGRTELIARAGELSGGTLDGVAAIAGIAAPISATASVNYFGAVATLVGSLPLLANSSAPRAVVVSSISSLQPADDELVELLLADNEVDAIARADVLAAGENGNQIYASSKQALSRWLRRTAPLAQWTGNGVTLNAVGPGVVITPMTAPLMDTPEALAGLMSMVPMPLNGPVRPEKVADLLGWLIGESNTHVTGQIVFIDGGYDALTRSDSVW